MHGPRQPDFLVVGSGLTGATLARLLHDAGQRVLVVERRAIPGGNVADATHPSGIRMSLHGPHYFRTSSPDLWQFVNRFTRFTPFQAVVRSRVGDRLENWPVAASCIRRLTGRDWQPTRRDPAAANFEAAALSLMPRVIYERFVKGYTEKQWGAPACDLSADLCKRFDVRADDDPRLTPDKQFQGIPTAGYSRMIGRMLKGIPLELNCDFLREREGLLARRMTIFTGPIDAFFDYQFGRLAYRGQRRRTWFDPNIELAQPCPQVNEPDERTSIIRTIEWKHMLPPPLAARLRGTLLTTEEPFTPETDDQFEYPFPDDENQALYRRYRARADEDPRVLICGRLGEYRYYDMDQAVARAQLLARRVLQEQPWASRSSRQPVAISS